MPPADLYLQVAGLGAKQDAGFVKSLAAKGFRAQLQARRQSGQCTYPDWSFFHSRRDGTGAAQTAIGRRPGRRERALILRTMGLGLVAGIMAILLSFNFGGAVSPKVLLPPSAAPRDVRDIQRAVSMQDQAQMSLKIRVRTASGPPRSARMRGIPDSPHVLHFFHPLSRGGGERFAVAPAY